MRERDARFFIPFHFCYMSMLCELSEAGWWEKCIQKNKNAKSALRQSAYHALSHLYTYTHKLSNTEAFLLSFSRIIFSSLNSLINTIYICTVC